MDTQSPSREPNSRKSLSGTGRPARFWHYIVAAVFFLAILLYIAVDQALLYKLASQRKAFLAAHGVEGLADLLPERVEDGDNAAVIYREAAAIIERAAEDTPDWRTLYYEYLRQYDPPKEVFDRLEFLDDGGGAPSSIDGSVRLGQFLRDIQPALDLLRKAQSFEGCQFGDYTSPEAAACYADQQLADMVCMRNLVSAAALNAVWQNAHDNSEEAFEWLTIGLRLSRNAVREPGFIWAVYSDALVGITLSAAQDVVQYGALKGNLPPGLQEELAARADRAQLARSLQDGFCYDVALQAHRHPTAFSLPQPRQTLWDIEFSAKFPAVFEIMEEPDFASRQALRAAAELRDRPWPVLGRLWGSMDSMVTTYADAFDRQVAQAQLCQLALALKEHKRDRGAYPAELNALVPTYRKVLPEDPLSGESYGYRTEGEGFELQSAPSSEGSACTGQYFWRSIR